MTEHFKYPRTPHLPWSEGRSDDDGVLENDDIFIGKHVVVTEKLDGENCVGPQTVVRCENGEKTIKDICEDRYKGKVLSYNDETNEYEWKEIEKYHITNTTEKDVWYEIEIENEEILLITEDDYVFLPKYLCYRKVKNLVEGDEVLLKK